MSQTKADFQTVKTNQERIFFIIYLFLLNVARVFESASFTYRTVRAALFGAAREHVDGVELKRERPNKLSPSKLNRVAPHVNASYVADNSPIEVSCCLSLAPDSGTSRRLEFKEGSSRREVARGEGRVKK